MLATYTANNIRIACMTKFNAHINQTCYAWINSCKGVVRQDALIEIVRNKLRLNVITRETKGGLRKVVSAK